MDVYHQTWATGMTGWLGLQDFHGDYKWMLFGHDDTFFFVNNVLELLQDFDSDLPYVISGMASWHNLFRDGRTCFVIVLMAHVCLVSKCIKRCLCAQLRSLATGWMHVSNISVWHRCSLSR